MCESAFHLWEKCIISIFQKWCTVTLVVGQAKGVFLLSYTFHHGSYFWLQLEKINSLVPPFHITVQFHKAEAGLTFSPAKRRLWPWRWTNKTVATGPHPGGRGFLTEKMPNEEKHQCLVSTEIISWPNRPLFHCAFEHQPTIWIHSVPNEQLIFQSVSHLC